MTLASFPQGCCARRSILRKTAEREFVRPRVRNEHTHRDAYRLTASRLRKSRHVATNDGCRRNGTVQNYSLDAYLGTRARSRKCGWRNINFAISSTNSTWKSSRAFVTNFYCDRQIINGTTSREPPVAHRR